ncbi:glycosyltransferase family 32 protein [Gryllotalpicola reticulitermitis]|uniref:Glycosyltransferase family 32 protein n=1 Tax=Gryllotalpicola reticulitermitis TaxID=1184153 RepID=A0ABV8Q4U7_9MICO
MIAPETQPQASSTRIPRVIHYCWFGGRPLPDFAQRCLDSWREALPEYRIQRWDESNWDVSRHPYSARAYALKRYAFVSDLCRLDVLAKHGGIYLDTDVVVFKSFDPLLSYSAFLGMMYSDSIGTAVMASTKDSELITSILARYDSLLLGDHPNNDVVTRHLVESYPSFVLGNHNQSLPGGIAIFDRWHFERFSSQTGRSYAQHLVANSWHDTPSRKIGPLAHPESGPGILTATLRERVGNLRTIPKAAMFRTYVSHKLRFKRAVPLEQTR